MMLTPTFTNPISVAWLAGILEGEGCFDTSAGTPRIRVKMGDKDVVERIAELWKTKVYNRVDGRSNHNQMYEVSIHGDTAIYWMKAVFQLMGDRRRIKILEILQYYEAKNNSISRKKPKNLARDRRKARAKSSTGR